MTGSDLCPVADTAFAVVAFVVFCLGLAGGWVARWFIERRDP